MQKKFASIFVCLLLISLVPTVVIAQYSPQNTSGTTGFGVGNVIGLFPSVSEDEITCFLLGPLMGITTLSKSRFNGHIGLLFLVGEYQWFPNGPPAKTYSNV